MRMIWLCVSSHWPLRLCGLKGLLSSRASGTVLAEADGAPLEVDPCDGAVGGVGLEAEGDVEVVVLLATLLSAVGSSEGNILAGASLMWCSLARKACDSLSSGLTGGAALTYCRLWGGFLGIYFGTASI